MGRSEAVLCARVNCVLRVAVFGAQHHCAACCAVLWPIRAALNVPNNASLTYDEITNLQLCLHHSLFVMMKFCNCETCWILPKKQTHKWSDCGGVALQATVTHATHISSTAEAAVRWYCRFSSQVYPHLEESNSKCNSCDAKRYPLFQVHVLIVQS